MQKSAKMFDPLNRIFLFSFCLLPLSVYLISDQEFESFKIEMNHLRSRQDEDAAHAPNGLCLAPEGKAQGIGEAQR